MNIVTNEVESNMTDFQFRAIIAMVLDKLESVKTLEELEETKKTLEKLTKGVTDIKENSGE